MSTEKIRSYWKGETLWKCSIRFPVSHCAPLHVSAPLRNPLVTSPVPNIRLAACVALIQPKGWSPWLEERWEHLQTTSEGEDDACIPMWTSVGRLLFHSSRLYQTICCFQRQLKGALQKPALQSRGRRAQALWDECDQELLRGVGISPQMRSAGELQPRCLENIKLLISATAHPGCGMGKVTLVTTALGFLRTPSSSCEWVWKERRSEIRRQEWKAWECSHDMLLCWECICLPNTSCSFSPSR